MIPAIELSTVDSYTESSKVWEIDFANNCLTGRIIDGMQAVAQSIYLTLQTPRTAHPIYPWWYGSELDSLIGRDADFAFSETKRMIAEALAADSRILSVEDFIPKEGVLYFTVKTIYGDCQMNRDVTV